MPTDSITNVFLVFGFLVFVSPDIDSLFFLFGSIRLGAYQPKVELILRFLQASSIDQSILFGLYVFWFVSWWVPWASGRSLGATETRRMALAGFPGTPRSPRARANKTKNHNLRRDLLSGPGSSSIEATAAEFSARPPSPFLMEVPGANIIAALSVFSIS